MSNEETPELKHISHDDIKPGYYIVEAIRHNNDLVIVVVGHDEDDDLVVYYHGNEEHFDLDDIKFIQAIDTLEIKKFYQNKK